MMQYILEAFALLAALLLQLVLSPHIAIAGVSPDIIFAVVVSLASFAKFTRGTAYGAAVGFTMDMLFLRPGFFLLQYTLSGALAGLVSTQKSTRFIQPILVCLPAYFVKEIITVIILNAQGAVVQWLPVAAKIGVGAIYTAAISFIIYLLAEFCYKAAGIGRGQEIIFDERR